MRWVLSFSGPDWLVPRDLQLNLQGTGGPQRTFPNSRKRQGPSFTLEQCDSLDPGNGDPYPPSHPFKNLTNEPHPCRPSHHLRTLSPHHHHRTWQERQMPLEISAQSSRDSAGGGQAGAVLCAGGSRVRSFFVRELCVTARRKCRPRRRCKLLFVIRTPYHPVQR